MVVLFLSLTGDLLDYTWVAARQSSTSGLLILSSGLLCTCLVAISGPSKRVMFKWFLAMVLVCPADGTAFVRTDGASELSVSFAVAAYDEALH